MKREIRPDQIGVAFPRMKRAKDAPVRCAPEKKLQDWTNAYLKAKGVPYLRLSAALLKGIFANPAIPIWIKRHIKEEVAGWPDNLCLFPVGNGLNLAVGLELKSEVGKLSQSQRTLAHEINIVVCWTREDVVANVEAAQAWAERVRAMQSSCQGK